MIIETPETEVSNLVKALTRLSIANVLELVGSRRVGCNIETADWDFMASDTEEIRCLLYSLGFSSKYGESQSGYMDNTTTAVFVKSYAFSNTTTNFNDLTVVKDTLLPVQIVLKKPEKYPRIQYFWKMMTAHPIVFREQFWKSYEVDGKNPTSSDDIRKRIEHWIDYVIPEFNLK